MLVFLHAAVGRVVEEEIAVGRQLRVGRDALADRLEDKRHSVIYIPVQGPGDAGFADIAGFHKNGYGVFLASQKDVPDEGNGIVVYGYGGIFLHILAGRFPPGFVFVFQDVEQEAVLPPAQGIFSFQRDHQDFRESVPVQIGDGGGNIAGSLTQGKRLCTPAGEGFAVGGVSDIGKGENTFNDLLQVGHFHIAQVDHVSGIVQIFSGILQIGIGLIFPHFRIKQFLDLFNVFFCIALIVSCLPDVVFRLCLPGCFPGHDRIDVRPAQVGPGLPLIDLDGRGIGVQGHIEIHLLQVGGAKAQLFLQTGSQILFADHENKHYAEDQKKGNGPCQHVFFRRL